MGPYSGGWSLGEPQASAVVRLVLAPHGRRDGQHRCQTAPAVVAGEPAMPIVIGNARDKFDMVSVLVVCDEIFERPLASEVRREPPHEVQVSH